jgi:hypothetical protein
MAQVQLGRDEATVVIANNLVRNEQMPLGERAARTATAIFAACAELRTRGLDTGYLLADQLRPQLFAFIRAFVAFDGKENGTRFELAVATLYYRVLELQLHPQLLDLMTQVQLPLIENPALPAKGPDFALLIEIGGRVRAHFVQAKSYLDASQLAFGRIAIYGYRVESGELFRQGVKDVVRAALAGGHIPGTSQVPGPIEVGNVHVFLVDETYLRNAIYCFALEAQTATQRTLIRGQDLVLDFPPRAPVDPEEIRFMFDTMFPDGFDLTAPDRADLLFESAAWLELWSIRAEAWLNARVADINTRFLVRPSSTDPSVLIDAVIAAQQAMDEAGPPAP